MRTRHAADLHLSSVSRLVHLETSKSQIVSVTFRLSFLAMRDWLLTLYLFSSPPSHRISWLIWNINIPGHACAHTRTHIYWHIYIKRVCIYTHIHSHTEHVMFRYISWLVLSRYIFLYPYPYSKYFQISSSLIFSDALSEFVFFVVYPPTLLFLHCIVIHRFILSTYLHTFYSTP